MIKMVGPRVGRMSYDSMSNIWKLFFQRCRSAERVGGIIANDISKRKKGIPDSWVLDKFTGYYIPAGVDLDSVEITSDKKP